MLAIGFVIALSRVFGNYLAASQNGMLLSYVLSVSIPAPMFGEWVQNPARLGADLDRPVATAVTAARTPWWR